MVVIYQIDRGKRYDRIYKGSARQRQYEKLMGAGFMKTESRQLSKLPDKDHYALGVMRRERRRDFEHWKAIAKRLDWSDLKLKRRWNKHVKIKYYLRRGHLTKDGRLSPWAMYRDGYEYRFPVSELEYKGGGKSTGGPGKVGLAARLQFPDRIRQMSVPSLVRAVAQAQRNLAEITRNIATATGQQKWQYIRYRGNIVDIIAKYEVELKQRR